MSKREEKGGREREGDLEAERVKEGDSEGESYIMCSVMTSIDRP